MPLKVVQFNQRKNKGGDKMKWFAFSYNTTIDMVAQFCANVEIVSIKWYDTYLVVYYH